MRSIKLEPASASGSVAAERLPYVPGAILEQSSAVEEPLPAGGWPRVDDYLDEPDEVHRWERIGDERQEALPATRRHGDPHFQLDTLVGAHLAEGYVGSVDLKTRSRGRSRRRTIPSSSRSRTKARSGARSGESYKAKPSRS